MQCVRVRVGVDGDSGQALANRMSGVDRPLDRFLILNGLKSVDQAQPGTRVKIITE